jgi:hypothetical protein
MTTHWTTSPLNHLQHHALAQPMAPALVLAGRTITYRVLYEELAGVIAALQSGPAPLPRHAMLCIADPYSHLLLTLAFEAVGTATVAVADAAQAEAALGWAPWQVVYTDAWVAPQAWPLDTQVLSAVWWAAAVQLPIADPWASLAPLATSDQVLRWVRPAAGGPSSAGLTLSGHGLALRALAEVTRSRLGRESVLQLVGPWQGEAMLQRVSACFLVGACLAWEDALGEAAARAPLHAAPAATHVHLDAAACLAQPAWLASAQGLVQHATLPQVLVEAPAWPPLQAVLAQLPAQWNAVGALASEACGLVGDHVNDRGVVVLWPGVHVAVSGGTLATSTGPMGEVSVRSALAAQPAADEAAAVPDADAPDGPPQAAGVATGLQGRLLSPRQLQLLG